MKKILYSLILIFITSFAIGQKSKVDSLEQKFNEEKDDFKKVSLLIKLCEYCDISDNLKYGNRALELITKLKKTSKGTDTNTTLLEQEAEAYKYIGIYYSDNNNHNEQKTIFNFNKSLSIFRELKSWDNIDDLNNMTESEYVRSGNIYMQLQTLKSSLEWGKTNDNKQVMARYIYRIARFYASIGDTSKAIEYAREGVDLEKKINDPKRLAKGYVLAGDLFAKIGLEHEAIKFYNKALVEYKKNNDSTEYVYIYLGLGSTYAIIANYEEANKNFKQALSCTKASNHSGTSPIEINIELGRLEYKFKNFSAAADYHKLALELSLQIGFPGGEAISSHELAKDLFQLKKYTEAKKHAERSLEIKKKITSVEQIMRTEKICFRIDSAIGNYKEALIHYMAFMTLQNKLNTEEIHRSSIKEDLNQKFEEEKEKEKLIQQKKEAEAASELKQQKFIRNTLFIGFLLLGLVAAIILRNYFAKKKLSAELANKNDEILHQKHLIEEKQKEVIDSIRYAKRIQTSLLPTEKYIERIFKDKK